MNGDECRGMSYLKPETRNPVPLRGVRFQVSVFGMWDTRYLASRVPLSGFTKSTCEESVP